MFGFGYLKLAVAGVALSLIVAAGISGYMAIKKIGAQSVVISTQEQTIDQLNKQLKDQLQQITFNKDLADKTKSELDKIKNENVNLKVISDGDCIDSTIPVSRMFEGDQS